MHEILYSIRHDSNVQIHILIDINKSAFTEYTHQIRDKNLRLLLVCMLYIYKTM